MKKTYWENRIREWSQKRIEIFLEDNYEEDLSPEVRKSGYLGYPGATEEEIVATEARLNVTFPPSYREFLKASNGLRSLSEYGLEFCGTEDIVWYAPDHQDFVDELIETWPESPLTDEEYFVYGDEQYDDISRPEYLQTALEISSEDMGVIFLLNPQIVAIDGEWEAWFCSFSTASFGAQRYRSFGEMMEEILNDPEFLG
ncbi:MAG: SMI1/KNR4 family protein [Nostoc sp. DedQUE04]|uniref:SMI1/KNR4 family protein n=1 Tax=Nostoc sp. DedQUE04 TaxID=3075390 RepID=UPI002AD4D403|nr:SMI1/KNR4 family protein [Nostoc sp. DedQUE04]MDZ8134056.1 SMI1/KNR4 family protein [Nostoc sp. DedQUE04]